MLLELAYCAPNAVDVGAGAGVGVGVGVGVEVLAADCAVDAVAPASAETTVGSAAMTELSHGLVAIDMCPPVVRNATFIVLRQI